MTTTDAAANGMADDDRNLALDHLGNVLTMLAELHKDDRCRAYDEALAYHNAARPDRQVAPVDGYSTRLVHTTPLDFVPSGDAG